MHHVSSICEQFKAGTNRINNNMKISVVQIQSRQVALICSQFKTSWVVLVNCKEFDQKYQFKIKSELSTKDSFI